MLLGSSHINCSRRVVCQTSSIFTFLSGETAGNDEKLYMVSGLLHFIIKSLNQRFVHSPFFLDAYSYKPGGSKVSTCMELWPCEPLSCAMVNISPKELGSQSLKEQWIWQASICRHSVGAGSCLQSHPSPYLLSTAAYSHLQASHRVPCPSECDPRASIHSWNFHRDSTSESRSDCILMFCLCLDLLYFTSANALLSHIWYTNQ